MVAHAYQLMERAFVRPATKAKPVNSNAMLGTSAKIAVRPVIVLTVPNVMPKLDNVSVPLDGRDIIAIDHATKERSAKIAKRNANV